LRKSLKVEVFVVKNKEYAENIITRRENLFDALWHVKL